MQNIYDYIIIGSGLTGQIIATRLSKATKNTLLLEAETTTGGANRPAQLINQISDAGLRFIPANSLSESGLLELENLLGLKLIKNIRSNNPKTYESTGFKDFVGFGDHPPAFYDQFNYFLSKEEFELTLPLHQIQSLLLEKYEGEILTRAHVTHISNNEPLSDSKMPSENELKAICITVNGSKKYLAKKVIYAGSARDLTNLVSDEVLNLRTKTKLKKDISWLALCLDLYTENEVLNEEFFNHNNMDPKTLFVLDGTTNDEIGPCVGRFQAAVSSDISENQKNYQFSQWVGFIDLSSSEETENIGEVLKKMRRQIKRAFPNIAESIKAERIFVSSAISSGELKLNANGTLAKLPNVWVASAAISKQPNLLGALAQAQMTLASLGVAEMNSTDSNQEITSETELIN